LRKGRAAIVFVFFSGWKALGLAEIELMDPLDFVSSYPPVKSFDQKERRFLSYNFYGWHFQPAFACQRHAKVFVMHAFKSGRQANGGLQDMRGGGESEGMKSSHS